MSDVEQLVEVVREAIKRMDEATRAIAERDQALGRLRTVVGGDGLTTIRNAQYRIGRLMTEEEAA